MTMLTEPRDILKTSRAFGPVAQLGARFHGMEEVVSSNLTRSTNHFKTYVPVIGLYAINQLPTAMYSVCVPLVPFKVNVNGAAPLAAAGTTTLNW